ncbi:hypothetical protein TELCIR_05379, partial [Teladorsagia circumcincta]
FIGALDLHYQPISLPSSCHWFVTDPTQVALVRAVVGSSHVCKIDGQTAVEGDSAKGEMSLEQNDVSTICNDAVRKGVASDRRKTLIIYVKYEYPSCSKASSINSAGTQALNLASGRVLNVGLMFVDGDPSMEIAIGYRTSASAVLIARDRIFREGLLQGYDFNLGIAIRFVMTSFAWNQFAFVYSNVDDDEKCDVMKTDVQNFHELKSTGIEYHFVERRQVDG